MAHRTGHRWAPDKATGPATLAAARWFGRTRFDEEHYKLTIIVNDLEVKTLDIDKQTGSLAVDVPARMLKPGKQRVNFQLVGRGQYTFQAILSGFVAADKLKSTTQDWSVKRHYEPAPLEFDGQEIPRGFGNLAGELLDVPQSAHAVAGRPPRACRAGNLAEQHPGQRAGGAGRVSRRHRAAAERRDGHREFDRRRLRAVRDQSGKHHVLRRRPGLHRSDPLRRARLSGRRVSGRADRDPQRLSARANGRGRGQEADRARAGREERRSLPPHAAGAVRTRQAAIREEGFQGGRRESRRAAGQVERATRRPTRNRPGCCSTSISKPARRPRSCGTSRSSRRNGRSWSSRSRRSSRSPPPITRWANTSGAISSSARRSRAASSARRRWPASWKGKANSSAASRS